MRLLILLLFIFLSTEAFSASVNVSPIRFDLSITHQKDVLTLKNEDDKSLLVQIDVYQKNKISQDIFVSPPIVKIPPHSSQLIRIALQKQPDPNKTMTYRIDVTEVQPKTKKNSGVDIALRLGIPVYVAPLS